MRMITGTGGFAIARSWVAVGASIGMLAAVTLSSATVAGAADTETIVGNTSSILVSADTTLQSWKNEKNQDNAAKSYIGALQPQGYGEFGEAFESTDTNDGTDAKMGLLSFDLSRYDSTPVSATLRLSYLGYAGRTSTDEQRTDSIVITAVDDTQCTNDADSCAPNTATWRTRPRFDATDGRQVARSNEFIVGLTKYGDNMTVSSATTVDVDVTDIVKNQMEQGRKSLTLAMGESKHIDVRFASSEGASNLSGAEASMAPQLIVQEAAKPYSLEIGAPTKTRYRQGESFQSQGLTVTRVSTSDGVKTVLNADQYTLSGTDYDTNDVGAHPITVQDSDDPTISATFMVYVAGDESTEDSEDITSDDRMWYAQPASQTDMRLGSGAPAAVREEDNNRWQQTTLPIGNGKLGGTIWGEVGTERITLNEETLWTGGPGSTATYNGGNNQSKGRDGATLRELNKQLESGKETVNPGNLTGGENANEQGAYQNWGNVTIDYGFGNDATYDNYIRDLDLSTGKAHVSFRHDGVDYSREFFVSNPDNVMVSRLAASDTGKLNLTIGLKTNASFSKTGEMSTVHGDTLTVKGALGNNGLVYNSQIKAVVDSGTVGVSADGTSLVVSDAKVVTLYVAAATDYKEVYPQYRTGESADDVDARVGDVVQAAANKGYKSLNAAHVADHRGLYDRVHLDLGQAAAQALNELATDKLVEKYANGSASVAQQRLLETTVYQYGRYLTIGSSRENSQLPSNLQGIWSSISGDRAHGRAPWGSDFHMNVNLQMNYWPTYSGNMAQLAEPLIEYAKGLVEPGRVTAKTYAGASTAEGTPIGEGEGFMAHTENTAYGWTAPGFAFSWGWSPAAVPWLLQNVYEAYEYSGDLEQLRNDVYPLLKEESHFYVSYMLHKASALAADGSARLTTGVAYSPEHGPQGTDGNTYESSLVWQMLNDAIESAQALGVDEDLVGNLEGCSADNWATTDSGSFSVANANRSWSCAQSLLKPIEVGADGQIKEWYFEGKLGKKTDGSNIPGYEMRHRHMSHLLGLFPGDLITIGEPTFMDAAKVSMTNRGDDATGWGVGQRINAWARTGDGNHAYKLIKLQLSGAMYPNLFDVHPPFQIDGNFGNTSGVNEMLLQSNSTFTDTDGVQYANYTNILPALPDAWKQGSADGLVARGNFTTSISWSEGSIDTVSLVSNKGNKAAVKLTEGDADSYEVKHDGEGVEYAVVSNSRGDKLITFNTAAGERYDIVKKSAPEKINVESVSVEGDAQITAGEDATLTATVTPNDATNQEVTWSSSNEGIATVDANGKVHAISAGQVIVSATSVDDPTIGGSMTITVTANHTDPDPQEPELEVRAIDASTVGYEYLRKELKPGEEIAFNEPQEVVGAQSREVISAPSQGQVRLASVHYVASADAQRGEDSFTVRYLLDDTHAVDVVYAPVVMIANEPGNTPDPSETPDEPSEGDGVNNGGGDDNGDNDGKDGGDVGNGSDANVDNEGRVSGSDRNLSHNEPKEKKVATQRRLAATGSEIASVVVLGIFALVAAILAMEWRRRQ